MKARDIRDLSPEERLAKLAEMEKELFNLRIQQTAGQLEKPDRVRLVRRDIARIKTVINQAQAAR
ncbi:MAG TPA: 50S ribosomal protein L29 [Kiritimatiellia bacterium]|jgi:large subunit ribosomal protein L29|nr:50S ribosomal protein L29 [Kiritimatiellia bacterium]OQC60696.1 MAG: 50S ribosomal protein L29 [Verrucomicrobia bacterium ADurb.Bin018]MBP9572094.1 50S ribosomal protein L29 [Kiritimatiellia bacterium]HOE00359.1 50S ribosomal protein L29 [Kiritimatiellia bacterium]HOE36820.1 50S ribosomal protein L29 [Kiritimatiellia bacterium]